MLMTTLVSSPKQQLYKDMEHKCNWLKLVIYLSRSTSFVVLDTNGQNEWHWLPAVAADFQRLLKWFGIKKVSSRNEKYYQIYLYFWSTGGPQIVLFLRPQGTVLLRKPYYSGTDLVLKSRFMTFGFSKSPFFAHFQAILIFETKKVIIWFHF